MHKTLNLSASLLLPPCLLALLVGGFHLLPKLTAPELAMTRAFPPNPACANPIRLIFLRNQLRFYHQQCRDHGLVAEAAADYNQCVKESDPSMLNGTDLPHRL